MRPFHRQGRPGVAPETCPRLLLTHCLRSVPPITTRRAAASHTEPRVAPPRRR
ncbi:hypothetical protein ACFPRL_19610 [Pseudoclavibacter helvolus]